MIQKRALLHVHHEGFLSVYHSEGCLNVAVFLQTISGASRFMYREYTGGCSEQTKQNLPCSSRTFAGLKSQLLPLFMVKSFVA